MKLVLKDRVINVDILGNIGIEIFLRTTNIMMKVSYQNEVSEKFSKTML